MARRKDKVVIRVVDAGSMHGPAARVPRGADRHKRTGAGAHGGTTRQKNRRDRQAVRRALREM